MGLNVLYPHPFEVVPGFNAGKPWEMVEGQIAWVPVTFVEQYPRIMELERLDPKNHQMVKYNLARMTSAHFKRSYRGLPVPELPLKESEEYMLHKAKKRPCILLSKNHVPAGAAAQLGAANHQLASSLVFVPLYSVSLSVVMLERVQKLQYSQMFYLPPQNSLKTSENDSPALKEGIARLDKAFVCEPLVPMVTMKDIKLTNEYLLVLKMLAKEYFLRETVSPLSELRETIK